MPITPLGTGAERPRAQTFVGLRAMKHRDDFTMRATERFRPSHTIALSNINTMMTCLLIRRGRPMIKIWQITTMESVSHLSAILYCFLGVLCLVRLLLTGVPFCS